MNIHNSLKAREYINNLRMDSRLVSIRQVYPSFSGSDFSCYILKRLSIKDVNIQLTRMSQMVSPEGVDLLLQAVSAFVRYSTDEVMITLTSLMSDPHNGGARVGSHAEGRSVDIMIVRNVLGRWQSFEYYSHLPTLRWISRLADYSPSRVSIAVEFDHIHLELDGAVRYKSIQKVDFSSQTMASEILSPVNMFLRNSVTNKTSHGSPVFIYYSHQSYYKDKPGLKPSSYRLPLGEGTLIRYY